MSDFGETTQKYLAQFEHINRTINWRLAARCMLQAGMGDCQIL